jgi:hypothetical protein
MSARSVWNTAFWPDKDFRDWNSVERFQEIQRILFDHLVLFKLDREYPSDDLFRKPIPYIRVAPSSSFGCPIMIARPTPEVPLGLWDDPVDRVTAAQVDLHFREFFDWNLLDYRDFQYYRVSIASFEEQPHLVGREALIERQYVKVFLSNHTFQWRSLDAIPFALAHGNAQFYPHPSGGSQGAYSGACE